MFLRCTTSSFLHCTTSLNHTTPSTPPSPRFRFPVCSMPTSLMKMPLDGLDITLLPPSFPKKKKRSNLMPTPVSAMKQHHCLQLKLLRVTIVPLKRAVQNRQTSKGQTKSAKSDTRVYCKRHTRSHALLLQTIAERPTAMKMKPSGIGRRSPQRQNLNTSDLPVRSLFQ